MFSCSKRKLNFDFYSQVILKFLLSGNMQTVELCITMMRLCLFLTMRSTAQFFWVLLESGSLAWFKVKIGLCKACYVAAFPWTSAARGKDAMFCLRLSSTTNVRSLTFIIVKGPVVCDGSFLYVAVAISSASVSETGVSRGLLM